MVKSLEPLRQALLDLFETDAMNNPPGFVTPEYIKIGILENMMSGKLMMRVREDGKLSYSPTSPKVIRCRECRYRKAFDAILFEQKP